MKEKIPLMLVLGIVGVLVISFVADSRVSATLMMDVEVCEFGYGCEVVGQIDITDIEVVEEWNYIAEMWGESGVDWEDTATNHNYEDYAGNFGAAFFSAPGSQALFAVFDDMPANIDFASGWGTTDLEGLSPSVSFSFEAGPDYFSSGSAPTALQYWDPYTTGCAPRSECNAETIAFQIEGLVWEIIEGVENIAISIFSWE